MVKKKRLLAAVIIAAGIAAVISPFLGQPKYDVVVLGSEPEAIAAAIAAAREGQHTLLLDTHAHLGGVFTRSKLNTLDISYAPDRKTTLTKGIFEEFFNGVHRKTSFDIEDASRVLRQLVKNESRLKVHLGVKSIDLTKDQGLVRQLAYTDSSGKQRLAALRQLIDSTPDADYAARLGVPFTYGQEDFRGAADTMCATLIFELRGVNWHKAAIHLRNDGNPATDIDAHSAWGFPEMAAYRAANAYIGARALNLGKQSNGNVLVNGLQIFGVKGTDPTSAALGRRRAKQELPAMIDYMRRLPGFDQAELVSTAPELYIRETRHLKGLYRLTIQDVLHNRDFEDRIAFGSYPVDIQRRNNRESDLMLGKPRQYAIPFRCIVAPDVTNLLIASRSASYDSLAHGSARTIPIGMAVAEAAGVAAAYANKHQVTFAEMASVPDFYHIHRIQKMLNDKGANLYPFR
ncbi:FAD-dependent oxidoreductase [Cohnella kolymensis]|uniref:FAD-dependent oxidoreductase n=1 Tax=Cohnella kolymensis TaxID=1590652 RepID=UPI00069689F3|nr:FAD-dependent oxidoreductase [Cohnella kolymensis]